MYTTRHSNVTDPVVLESLWGLYSLAYEPLATRTPSYELLYRSEFDATLADPTNRIVVLRDDNRPIAMSVTATDIASTRYLSRAYFEARYPERMAAGLVHYILWIVIHPSVQGSRAVFELSRAGFAPESAEGALLVFDLPEWNQPNETGGGAELMYRMGRMVGPVNLQSFGGSRYYALDFAPESAAVSQTDVDTEPANV